MIIALVIIAICALFATWVRTAGEGREISTEQSKAWEAAAASEESQVGRILLNVSRPMATVPAIHSAAASPMYRNLQERLLGAGNIFGSSVEVFLSVQALCLFLGAVTLVAALSAGLSGILLMAAAAFGIGITAYPWNTVSKKATKRLDAVNRGLPEFAELLQMPLSAGMGVLQSLSFTAERLTGPVAEEVRVLLSNISSKSMNEAQAFRLAGVRLGTPESQAFFTALMQAHIEGARVAQNLASQAEALRLSAHQRARSEVKKLPVKLVIILGLHIITALFIIILIPVFVSLGGI